MEGFDSAYRRHFPAVFRFARSLVGRRDVAEDLTADAFLELHRQFDRIRVDALPAWLFVVVRNRARDLWRRQLVEQKHMTGVVQEWAEAARPAARPLWLSAAGLSPIHRVCLELHYVWGYTVMEIAARLGLTDGQVKGHLQRARQRLRDRERNPADG
jgi:RNA polymerase sigma-70 factor (ECF subfamily)